MLRGRQILYVVSKEYETIVMRNHLQDPAWAPTQRQVSVKKTRAYHTLIPTPSAAGEDPASLALPRRNPIHRKSSSEQALEVLDHWIRKCCSEHEACQSHTLGAPFVPDRLVDLGQEDSGMIRLVVSPTSGTRYLALSYCWERQRSPKLPRRLTIATTERYQRPPSQRRTRMQSSLPVA